MNGFALIVGYCVLGLAVPLGIAILVGKFFDRKPDAVPEDWDPAPRGFVTPLVPEQWKPSKSDLEDPNTRDTPPPSDPAS